MGPKADAFYYQKNPAPEQYVDYSHFESALNGTTDSFEGAPKTFSDPTRTITTYLTSSVPALGPLPATLLGYLKLLKSQSKQHWDDTLRVPHVADYLRAGHDMTYAKSEP